MKSTLTKKTMTNDIFLQLLEVKDDFDKASSKEIYTRSTTNYWIAGNRVYHNGHDYTELYLIASKKDTSLAEVEGKAI
ncbi:hypothetical protein RMCBS344292_17803 [Rhizopus microsporus]|nr:hypothetical protein RMCBS344292_10672 [Rhizopus microsporus]CEJ03828.1 hypothetical protein RMCBS344292_17803 [Rhizopus microsporus]